MKMNEFKRLIKEDFPKEYHGLIEKLAFPLNQALEEVYTALRNNMSFADNFAAQEKILEVMVDASGLPTTPTSFKSTLGGLCKGIDVLRAENITNSATYPTGSPFISFTEGNGQIIVKHIAGLPANNKFRLRIVAFR